MSSGDDAWFLPDEAVDRPAGEPGSGAAPLSVRDVGERIQQLLNAGFPAPFWMVGETLQLERAFRRSGVDGHWYFDLVDDEARGGDRPSLAVKMWKTKVRELFGRGGRLHQRIEPVDGVVLKVLVRPDFYLPRGQLSFTIQDIDPSYTEGGLERARREVLERLSAEGVLERNGRHALPDVPLRIGLVTSKGSAAHHDVLETLRTSALGFSVLLCDARTQGPVTGPSVCAALDALARAGVDVVLLVRGGGSRHDLSWFDREDIARAIAACPVPVLTGIGHEIDTSVADAAAHTAFKTPTAAAEFLVQRGRDGAAAAEDAYASIVAASRQGLVDGARRLADQARLLRLLSQGALDASTAALVGDAHRVRDLAEQTLGAGREHLAVARSRLASGPFVERLSRHDEALVQAGRRLLRCADGLSTVDRDLSARARLVSLQAGRRLVDQESALDLAEQRARLLDPRTVLERGYAWLVRADGSSLKDAVGAQPGEALTARLRDGALDVVVAPRPGRAAVARVLPLLLVLAAAVSCGDAPDPVPPPVHAPRQPAAPILFVLIDTLRADHTSIDEHRLGRRTTPFLDELAADSFVFERAYSAASWTRPSVASIFTSRLPPGHACEAREDALSRELVTLAEVLELGGYRNSAVFTNGQILAKNGFDQGFHDFVHVRDHPRNAYADALKMRQPVIEVVDALRPRAEPWFLYLHYVDPHDPYIAHESTDFSPGYEGPADGSKESLDPYRWETPPEADKQRFIDLYDGDILYIDHELRRLFARLDERGMLERAWVVITSDHGEGLWDHRIQAHGQEVFEHQIHVPLIVRPPGGLPGGRRIDVPISQIDLAPTLLELVGLDAPPEFDGRSWAPALLRDEPPPARPVIVVENVDFTRMQAIIDGHDKLILDRDEKRPSMRLYDLATNPRERPELALDAATSRSAKVSRLERLLRDAVDASAARSPARVAAEFDAEDVAALAAIGYAQEVTSPTDGEDGDEADADGDAADPYDEYDVDDASHDAADDVDDDPRSPAEPGTDPP